MSAGQARFLRTPAGRSEGSAGACRRRLIVSPGDLVAYRELLKLGQNPSRAWTVEEAEEPVEPVVV